MSRRASAKAGPLYTHKQARTSNAHFRLAFRIFALQCICSVLAGQTPLPTGATPLHAAVLTRNIPIIQTLLQVCSSHQYKIPCCSENEMAYSFSCHILLAPAGKTALPAAATSLHGAVLTQTIPIIQALLQVDLSDPCKPADTLLATQQLKSYAGIEDVIGAAEPENASCKTLANDITPLMRGASRCRPED